MEYMKCKCENTMIKIMRDLNWEQDCYYCESCGRVCIKQLLDKENIKWYKHQASRRS